MKSKKGKALAMKLIDDLLGDEDSKSEESKQISQEQDATVRVGDKKRSEDNNEGVVELSQSIFTDESNPFGAESSEPVVDYQDEHNNDATVKLNESKIIPSSEARQQVASSDSTQIIDPKKKKAIPENTISAMTSSNIKASVGRYVGSGGMSSPTQTTLVQSENLRMAQQKILELEEEISRLRTQNEDLAAAGETLRRVADESKSAQESLERKLENVRDLSQQEHMLMKEAMETKDRKVSELQTKLEEMELRLSTNIQKIRVRERELENRLELVRMEGDALARSKDELVLDLKRQVDQLNIELENYRSKGQELNSQLKDKQELLRRTVKALRLALSMLEGDEEINFSLKKVK